MFPRASAFVVAILTPLALASFTDRTPQPVPVKARAFLDKNCTGCHTGAKAPAGLDLSNLAFDLSDVNTYDRWVRVHDAVRDGMMPPAPKLDSAQRRVFLNAIADPILGYERNKAAMQGRSVLRRLNRYEYENTLRDLLDAPWLQLRDSLPEDGIVQRFNKVGQALDISHVQMARYMETAEDAIRQVLKAQAQPAKIERFYARDQRRLQNRMRYSPFNNHPERASIPILGFEAQPAVLNETAPMSVGPADPKVRELEGFATPASTYIGNEYHFDQFKAPAGGEYRVRFNAFSLWIHTVYAPLGKGQKTYWWRPDRERTSKGRTTEPVTLYALAPGGEKRLLGSFDVAPDPVVHELTVQLLAGEQILPDASRLFRSRPGFVGSPEASAEGMPGVAYRWMEVEGPTTPSSLKLLEGNAPEPLLRRFMTAAYRRPPTQTEVARYLKIVKERIPGAGFEEAMIAGYVSVLCSPGFLYLEEAPGPLTGHALANRLAYFLWNAPPDAELRKLAASGAIRRPEVLRAQTDRLLNHARSRDFSNAFLDYWLDLRKLNDTTPDVVLYPDYYLDDLLNESATNETQLFFSHALRKNLPARTLVKSDFTFLNEHLARHYGVPGVRGVAMQEVKLPANTVRGGLLTQASLLKVTANGTTTSPVLRGVWIMERILGDPLPPPPPGLPAVEPDTRGATTIRQQLDKHRAVQSCAVCHVKIDPPGFALETFDVLGGFRDRYRSTEQGQTVKGLGKNGHQFEFRLSQPVDSSGQLATGEAFQNVVEFKELLARNERQVARNMARQFIAYATGAPATFADRAEVERILDASKTAGGTRTSAGYGLRDILHNVVQSRLFTFK